MPYILLGFNSIMHALGQHEEFPEMRITFVKLQLWPSGWFCVRLPLGAERG